MIQDNVFKIKERITLACARFGRDPLGITIVAVSKTRTPEQIKEVVEAGVSDIGENRVQEALDKYCDLRITSYGLRIKWHLVGHLQTNKAKDAVKIFDLIHSVDSLRLAQEINKQAQKIGKIQEILLEVKTSKEPTKCGFEEEEIIEAVREISRLKNVCLRGLMTIAPIVDNPEQARPYFKVLRELRNKIYDLRITDYELPILSMGMTDDFEVAIEEGATMVRIGRAIFDER